MLKRLLIIFIALLAGLFIAGIATISSSKVALVANYFLPEGWAISTPNGLSANRSGAKLPQFSLSYQGCNLIQIDELAVHWQNKHSVLVDKAILDYHCLTQLPKSDDPTTGFSLLPILAVLPEGEAKVQALHWINLPDDLPPRLAQLLTSPSEAKLTFFQPKLNLYIKQQAVTLETEFANSVLKGNLSYQPSQAEKHNLLFTTTLNENLLELPKQFESDYHWVLPKEIVANEELQAGSALISWKPDEQENLLGTIVFVSQKQPRNSLNLPFKFDFNSLEIYQGKFNWEWLQDFPINGSTTAKLTPKNIMKGEIFPLQSEFRANFFSHDKRTLSIATTKAVWKNARQFDLPFTLSGNLKYDNYELSGLATVMANEHGAQFSPKSMFYIVSGKERFLTIKELAIPLGNIAFNKYGVTGRFQPSFKGETPDFGEIELKMDGTAKNFKMGMLNFFEDYPDKKAEQDQWNWTLSGTTLLKAFNSKINLEGKGYWHHNLVQISQLNGLMNQINHNGVNIPKTELRLTEKVKFAYEKWHLTGGAKLKSPEVAFSYGGKLIQPETDIKFSGELENLAFDGKIQAGKVGPIHLKAQRKLSEKAQFSQFSGSLKWQEQPANVFQPLIPFRQNWLITNGSVTGETHFKTVGDGSTLTASGQISIKNGEISLPKGEIKGIAFDLPYQLIGSQFTFGKNKPIAVTINELNVGLPITDIHLNVDGSYPYRKGKPLNLSKLTMKLLDGKLKIERFALPQVQPAFLELEGIDLERVLELTSYKQIELKGRANATLPFWLSGNPCYVCDGLLTQAEPSNLKISQELMQAISSSSGYSEQILLYLLNDTRANELRALINVGSTGDMVLDAKLKLQLNQQEKAKVNFNYNHRENIFHLWHMINSGSYVEQGIENSIYQKLDSSKK